ncbi:MAG: hypothetical protein WB975_01340, partial [Nitrososphaeraceae archaeon]
ESFIPGLRPTRLGDPGSISIFLSLYINPSKEQDSVLDTLKNAELSCRWYSRACQMTSHIRQLECGHFF